MIPRRDKHHRTKQRGQSQTAHKSGGRQPAVVIGIAGATEYVLVESGGCQRGSVRRSPWSENRTAFSDDRLHDQERRASARRGYRYRSCNGASTNSRQTADGVCADRRCGRVYGRHRANVAPESVMGHTAPDYNRVHWRHGGLTPPALVLRCERLPAKQRFLRCTNAHSTKSGGRQPAVVVRDRQERCRKVARLPALHATTD
jgi:hypothetical protein